ncbi:MAG TPA: hypothetical protein VH084_10185 [Mycobacterium sp.]|jgi:hypothetical protein|nr:hypothetical protein [Mycobacterium sp.]
MSILIMPEPQPKRQTQKQQESQESEVQSEQEQQQASYGSASDGGTAFAYAAEPAADGGSGGSGIGVRAGGGGGTINSEGQSMSAVMDDLLGSDIGAPLASVGPASAQVVEAMPRGAGQSFLATVFWWLFIKSPAYLQTVRQLGAAIDARPIVVTHAEGTRFDLLLLDRQRGDDWAALQLDRLQTPIGMVSPDVSEERLSGVLHRADLADTVAPATLLASARELAASSQFGVAVATAPEELPTCAVSPSLSVYNASADPVATLGAFMSDSGDHDDTCVVTTVDHVLKGDWQQLTVGGAPLDVVARHPESDSCLLRVSRSLLNGRQRSGLKGPLRTAPIQHQYATFDGAMSGVKQVRVREWDPSIVDPSPDELIRVYTEPDTRVGDSGAALISQDDFIVGFARRITGRNAAIQYSSWTYALMVYMAHDLLNRVALGV